ncbi:MAG TPA: O-methyltransferase [Nitrolancea sp.]|jgi:predicted O-methyltransferase YrrM|nr:O-methyltransferase [Nitrolancea sp.]
MTNPDYQHVLRDIEASARERHWPIVGPRKGAFLVEIVQQHKPRRILELGALVGYSSTLMAANLEPGGRVFSIEIDPANAELTRETQRRAGVADRCEVHVGPALTVIPQLDGPWDLVFIDAAKEQYLAYLQAVEPFLAVGAVIVADNIKIAPEAIAPYIDYVRNSPRYASTYHDFDSDGMEVSIFNG